MMQEENAKGRPSTVLGSRSKSFASRLERAIHAKLHSNSGPRQTHERRVLHEGASFAFCAAFSRGGPGRLVPRCLGVLTAGSPDSPAGPPNRPKVSPGLFVGGCWVQSGSGPLERSLPRGRGRWGGGGQSTSNRAQSPRSLRSVSSAPRGPEAIAADRTPPSIDVNASSSAMRSGGPAIRVAPTGPNRSGTLS